MKIKIEKMGINGEGIGYIDHLPTFVDGTYPKEVAEVEIVRRFERYIVARKTELHEKSPFRVEAKCPIQDECGGCAIMTLDVSAQQKEKNQLIWESLRKYVRGSIPRIQRIITNTTPYRYRNQCKFPVVYRDGELQSGMFRPQSNQFVFIERCIVHSDLIEQVRLEVMRLANEHRLHAFNPPKSSGLRYLVVRGFNDEVSVTLVTGDYTLPKEFVEDVSKIATVKSISHSINPQRNSRDVIKGTPKILWGSKTITATLDEFKFVLSPQSFFQLNVDVAAKIYRKVASLIEPTNVIVEAYCGVGGMSIYLKDKAKKIIGMDFVGSAIENAKINAQINQASNVEFLQGDSAEILKKISKQEKIDVLVVDPPRSGLSDQMLDAILSADIKKIIYVSCNPSTLGKNLNVLLPKYKVLEIQPYDMFTHTPLIEAVVSLQQREEQ